MAVKWNRWKTKFIPCVNRDGIVISHRSLIKYGGKRIAPRLSNTTCLNCGNAPFLRNAVSSVVIMNVIICSIYNRVSSPQAEGGAVIFSIFYRFLNPRICMAFLSCMQSRICCFVKEVLFVELRYFTNSLNNSGFTPCRRSRWSVVWSLS
jgi:hypothetical protein